MPSTATITAFHEFSANTVIKSAFVNANFALWRGHVIPIDPTATSSPDVSYDLGADGHAWRALYSLYGYFKESSTVTTNPPSGYMAIYAKDDNKIYKRTSAGAESEVGSGGGGGAFFVSGTRAAPSTITVAGITFDFTTTSMRYLYFVAGDTSTGTDVTADPQISAGSTVGTELVLVGRGNPITLENGTGLSLNGNWNGFTNSTLGLHWDGSEWVEMFRRDA